MSDSDYHNAEARYKSSQGLWRAQCSKCGYRGPYRSRKSNAEDDGLSHDQTMNSEINLKENIEQ